MASAAMPGTSRRPGGLYAEWTDSIEDDPPGVPEAESSTRVITAPLPRLDASAGGKTTTAPMGLRVEGHEASPAPSSTPALPGPEDGNKEESAPPSGRGKPLVPIQHDATIDRLLDRLDSPLGPAEAPEGFAASVGPTKPPARQAAALPASSVQVTDSVLKGKPLADASRYAKTVSVRRPEPVPDYLLGADADADLVSPVDGRRTRLVVLLAAIAVAIAAAIGLVLRATNSPVPAPDRAKTAAPPNPHIDEPTIPPVPPSVSDVPSAVPTATADHEEATAPAAPPARHSDPRPSVAAPVRKAPSPTKPAASAESDDDIDMQIKIREKK
jgi:hypothetical protein